MSAVQLFSAVQVDATLRKLLSRIDSAANASETATLETERAEELLARIAWSRIAEPGDGVAGALISALGARHSLELLIQQASADTVRAAARSIGLELGTQTKKALHRWLPRLSKYETTRDVERATEAGLRVILPGDSLWPTTLSDLGTHEPTMLWFRGDANYLRYPSLSVVGGRAVTGYGTHVTAEIVEGVCHAGFAIVSGAAYGVDAVAHRTSLALERPTVAVLAGGADRPYPAAHDTLLQRITENGVVCSEMIPGAAPTRWRFLQRNRIIAALSQATLVTEAGIRSGTINTAGHAASLGRALGAVPGPITSAASAGCHKLIKEYGAELITNAQDILGLLGVDDGAHLSDQSRENAREPSAHHRVLDALPLRGRRSLADVARKCGLSPDETDAALVELELLGRVRRDETPSSTVWSLLRQ